MPVRFRGTPTFFLASGLDVVLLVLCFLALRRGRSHRGSPSMAAVFFGATFIAGRYGWNGGGVRSAARWPTAVDAPGSAP